MAQQEFNPLYEEVLSDALSLGLQGPGRGRQASRLVQSRAVELCRRRGGEAPQVAAEEAEETSKKCLLRRFMSEPLAFLIFSHEFLHFKSVALAARLVEKMPGLCAADSGSRAAMGEAVGGPSGPSRRFRSASMPSVFKQMVPSEQR